jgi:hypothetical protein
MPGVKLYVVGGYKQSMVTCGAVFKINFNTLYLCSYGELNRPQYGQFYEPRIMDDDDDDECRAAAGIIGCGRNPPPATLT